MFLIQKFGCFHEKPFKRKYFMQILEKISAIVYNDFNTKSAAADSFEQKERWLFFMDMLEAVKEILSNQLRVDVDEIDMDTDILNDLGADSLDIVEMLMTIEQEYGIVVPDDVITTLKTVGDVAKYIENNQ